MASGLSRQRDVYVHGNHRDLSHRRAVYARQRTKSEEPPKPVHIALDGLFDPHLSGSVIYDISLRLGMRIVGLGLDSPGGEQE